MRYIPIGSVSFPDSNSGISVALYAPAIVRKQRFCACSSLAIKLVFVVSAPIRENHMGALYITAECTTAVYTSFALLNISPHIEVAIL